MEDPPQAFPKCALQVGLSCGIGDKCKPTLRPLHHLFFVPINYPPRNRRELKTISLGDLGARPLKLPELSPWGCCLLRLLQS